MRESVKAALVACLAAGVLSSAPVLGGVRLGDAVPGIIKGSDLERIKRQLDLERFSIIAAVWLGADEGREAILVEPLAEKSLSAVQEACARGGFCPDRFGFIASRVRIILLQNNDVVPVVSIDREVVAPRGRLLDLTGVVARGPLVGWSGWAEASEDHVALALTPLVEGPGGRLRAGSDEPIRVRWNRSAARFQIYDCVPGRDGGEEPTCAFRDEMGR